MSHRAHGLAIIGFTLLTVALTWPVSARLFTEVPGGGDAWQNIWNLWWVKRALLEGPTDPYFTDLLFYPDGVPLYFHTLVFSAGIIGIPLQLLGFNLVATYNLTLLLSFLLAGYGTFLLCHYVSKSLWGSFAGGIVFAFAPYHSAHMYGHMNLSTVQWLPFYVLLLLMALDAMGTIRKNQSGDSLQVRRALPEARMERRFLARNRPWLLSIGAGALLAVNAYTDWIYAIFLVVLTGLILLWKAVAPGERTDFQARGVGWIEAALRVVVVGITFLVITSPIFFATLSEAGKGYAQQPSRETLVYSSDVALAFLPSELHPIWGNAVKEYVNELGDYTPIKNPSERTVFLGYTVLALSGFALWRLWRDRRAQMWAMLAGATWVLSLGPLLQLFGKTEFTAFNVTVPLPYLLLYKLPLFNIMRTPSRLVVLTMLALGVLVALAIAALPAIRRQANGSKGEGTRNALTALVRIGAPALILFEFLAAPFTTVPPGWDVPIYKQISQEQGDFALLELPLRPFSDYMAYQTIHGKPLVGGYVSRQPPYATLNATPALQYLLDATPADGPLRQSVAGGRGADALEQLGVKYVIIRWWAFTEEQKVAMRAKLDVLMGRPADNSYMDPHQVEAWRLFP